MRLVIQRCSRLMLTANGELRCSKQGPGLLVLAGWGQEDDGNDEEMRWVIQKILQMRIFSDAEGKMNLSVQDVKGYVAVVSNFTLYASTKKGNRPSFVHSAPPEKAKLWYEKLVAEMRKIFPETYDGIFGADMKIDFVNDGPVTIIIDTLNKE
ncbi:MAG: D-aminoacyl-tRNA deacylase [Bacteroidia bacterium]|nr:D-aminoacyl-tRNA deacylase [Bacteroidia bacterium]